MSSNGNIDPRIVCGARCLWWDSIDKVFSGSIPLCPKCKGPLFEYPTIEHFMGPARQYQDDGHPGYVALVEWTRGKCYPTIPAVVSAYTAITGNKVIV